MRKCYIFQEDPILMKVLPILSKNDISNRNLFPDQLIFLIDAEVMGSSNKIGAIFTKTQDDKCKQFVFDIFHLFQ